MDSARSWIFSLFLFGFLDDIAQMIPTFTPYEFAML